MSFQVTFPGRAWRCRSRSRSAAGRPSQSRGQLQVGPLHPRRERELGPLLAVAHAEDGRVDRHGQRLVARRLGAVHQGAGEFTVRLHVELEPERSLGGRRDVLQGGRGIGAEDHGGARRIGAPHRGQFALGMREPVVGRRGQQDRKGQLAAEQRGARVEPRHIHQIARPQADVLVGLVIPPLGQLVDRAAVDVLPGHLGHVRRREPARVRYVDRSALVACGRRDGAAGSASPVSMAVPISRPVETKRVPSHDFHGGTGGPARGPGRLRSEGTLHPI